MGGIAINNNVQNQRQAPALYEDILANIPAAGFIGRLFISTDTHALYRDNGVSYDLIGAPGSGTISGAGTPGRIAKFSGSAVIGDSILSEAGTVVTAAGSLAANAFVTAGGLVTQYITGTGSLVPFPTQVSAFTNDAGYITAGGAANLTNKTGNISMWTNDSGYITASSVSTLTNKSGNISQWTNNSGYITASGVATLTNKSGNISMWTNDAGYITAGGAVTSIAGTANQVIASSAVGAVTLSLPQSIATTSQVTFGGLAIGGNAVTGRTNFVTQISAGGSFDFYRIYLYEPTLNNSEMVFEVGDEGQPWGSNGERFRFSYNAQFAGVDKDVLYIDYNTSQFNTTLEAISFITTGGLVTQYITGTGSLVTFPTVVSAFTNDAGYITAVGAANLTNKTGNISMWTNDSGYITAAGAANLTNKTGNISMWTNDSGYITSASLTGYLKLDNSNAPMTNNFSVNGSITSNSGNGVYSLGANSGYNFVDRTTNSQTWVWYADTGSAHLFSSFASTNVFNVAFTTGAVSMVGSAFVNGATLQNNEVLGVAGNIQNTGANPTIVMKDTGGATNKKLYEILNNGGNFLLSRLTDNYVTRTVYVVVGDGGYMNVAGAVNVNGAANTAGIALNVAGQGKTAVASAFSSNTSVQSMYMETGITGTGFTNTTEILLAAAQPGLGISTTGTNTFNVATIVAACVGRTYMNGASGSWAKASAMAGSMEFAGGVSITDASSVYTGIPYQQAAGTSYTGTITNYSGIEIEDISGNTDISARITNKYGIRQKGGSDKNFLNGELILGVGQVVSASVLNTVTNKVKVTINGTAYYLLANTSNA